MRIHEQLVAVTRKITAEGIGKTRDNKQQGYKFRGIDEVMQAFAPILAAEGLILRPSFTERECIERQTKAGGAIFSVSVAGTFAFVNDAGEELQVGPFYGEAMDTADKATNKAMAVAFKYAMFQTFCVPLEGVTDGDADATTHEVAARENPHQAWADAAEAVVDETGYAKLRAEVVAKFDGEGNVPTQVRAALGTAKFRIGKKAA
jgi:hypothetical protein